MSGCVSVTGTVYFYGRRVLNTPLVFLCDTAQW